MTSELLPVIGQNLLAGPAQPGAVLLEAGQNGHIAVVHHRTAMTADVTRASRVRPSALRRRRRDQQNKREDEKKSSHNATPASDELPAF
jgi:hypothetical protein